MRKNNKGQFLTFWTNLPVNEESQKFWEKVEKQRKEADPNKRYILDPFQGLIERKEKKA